MAILKFFEIHYAVRAFIEQKIHNGQIGLEAVFPGKDLEIRLFQIQALQYGIRALWMYEFTIIITNYCRVY